MSDVTIDKIQIEIDAKATKADKALEKLEKVLNHFKSSLTGFNTTGIDNMTNAINKAQEAADKLNKTSVTPKVNTSSISSAEKKISRELEKIQDKFTRLNSLELAIKGGDNSALTSWQRLATSLQGDIDVLGNKIKRLGDTRIHSDGFKQLEAQIESVRAKADELVEKEKNPYNGHILSNEEYIKLQMEMAKTSDELDKLIEKQRQMIADGSAFVDPFQKYREGVTSVQSDLDGAKDRMSDFGQTSEEVSKSFDATQIISILKQVASQTTKVIKKMLQLVGGTIKKGFHALASSISKVKDALSGTGKNADKFHKFMNKGFMLILKYGFGIRSLYVGFRRLRKAIIESFGELQKSGAFYETTRRNIENLKNSLNLLKYQFGAAFEPIFNAVAPALNVFIQHILKAMNAFSAFTAKLMGKDSYSKAVLKSTELADSTKDAAKAQKELNKQLRGFDELNNLTTSTSGKGSGSGSSDNDDDNITYVSQSVDSVLGDFGKSLADLIKKGDWGGVGTAISEKLTAVLQGLNSKWPEIFEKAANFGTELAKFFKGLITPELFGEIGKALGNALKAALTATFNFAQTMSEVNKETGRTGWQQLGDSIAAGINEFVKTNPLKLVVANFNVWAKGLLDALIAAIDGIEWEDIAQHIADAIAEIDASGIGWKLGKLVSSLTNALYTLVSKKETWENLGQKIADGINGFFQSMSENDGFEKLAKSLSSVITGIADTISTALENIDWDQVGEGVNDFFSNIDWENIKKSMKRLGNALKKALVGLLKGLDIDASDIVIALAGVGLVVQSIAGISLASTITKVALSAMIKNAITGLFAGGSGAAAGGAAAGATAGGASTVLVALGEVFSVAATVAGVALSFAASAAIGFKFGNTFGEFIAYWLKDHGIISSETADEYYEIAEGMSFTQKVKDIFLAAGEKTAGGENRLKKAFEDMVYDWYEPVFEEGVQITASVKELVLDVKDFAVSIGGKIKTAAEIWNDFWGDVGEAAYDKTISIKTAFEDTKESLKKKFEGIVGDIFTKAHEIKTKVVETADSKLTDIKTKVDGMRQVTVNFLSKGAKKVVNNIKAIQKAFKKVKNSKIRITEEAGSKLRDIKDKFTSIARNLQYLKNNAKIKIEAAFSDKFTTPLENAWKRMIDSLKKMRSKEKGGVYSNGSWHNIPQYASGTIDALKHGSVFVAGEKGPEVAGHINGRTEILNKSQLASIMYTSITRGMAQFRNAKVATPQSMGFADNLATSIATGISSASDTTLMEEQNKLIAEQNRLLRQIANKDVTVSSRDIYKATMNEARLEANRTGYSPFVF